MNAWVLRHLDELRQIYGRDDAAEGERQPGVLPVVSGPTAGTAPSVGPGAVLRGTTPEGDDDVILLPRRRDR